MLAALGLSFLLQQPVPAATAADRKRDSVSAERARKTNEHIAAAASARARAKARAAEALKSLTPEIIASAFKDRDARDLLLHARQARLIQDSALVSYDANAYQRVSAWLGFGLMTRARLIFRMEQAGRVRWQRDVGRLDGRHRRALGAARDSRRRREGGEQGDRAGIRRYPSVPYFPGAEPLWAGQELMRDSVEDDGPIHPLAAGSELYYTYATGDSVTFHLGDGTTIQIRSLEIRPRTSPLESRRRLALVRYPVRPAGARGVPLRGADAHRRLRPGAGSARV